MIDAAQTAPTSLEARLADYRPQVRRHILAMVRDAGLADELTQDTYTRALERVDQLRDPQAGLAWLYRIATTVTLDRLRQRRPTTIPLDTVAPAGAEAEQAAARARPPSLLEGALESSEMSECMSRVTSPPCPTTTGSQSSSTTHTASATRRSPSSSAAHWRRRRSGSTAPANACAKRSPPPVPSRST